MHQVVNEMSFNGGYSDKFAAIAGMKMLVICIKRLAEIGFSGNVFMTDDIRCKLLTADYSINDWLYDRSVKENLEPSLILLKLMTNSPSSDRTLSEYDTDTTLYEFNLNGLKSIGGGLSYFLKTPLVSSNADAIFCCDLIRMSKIKITADCEVVNDVDLLSIYELQQIDRNQHALQELLNCQCKSGLEMLQNCEQVFPKISFCNNAHNQIQLLSGKEHYFPIIIRHLNVLNNTMLNYQEGLFEPKGVEYSPESETTLAGRREQRTFTCPDGIDRVFTLHTKIKSFNKRIFFYPDCENKIVFVAHIGDKLPTTRYRT